MRSIASLAPLVVAAAEHGDAKAEAILDWAATDLAELVARTADADRTGTDEPIPLAAFGGGLLGRSRADCRNNCCEWLQRVQGGECDLTLVDGSARRAAFDWLTREFAGTLVAVA